MEMKKFLQKKLKSEKGMTLIELLAVIVIIAIIAAIAIPAISNIIENSRVGAAKSDILNAQAAAELFLADNPKASSVTLANLQGQGTVTNSDGTTSPVTVGSSYLDSPASLESFTYNANDKLVTASAFNDGIRIVATNATKEALADLPSNTTGSVNGGAASGTTTIVVSRNVTE